MNEFNGFQLSAIIVTIYRVKNAVMQHKDLVYKFWIKLKLFNSMRLICICKLDELERKFHIFMILFT